MKPVFWIVGTVVLAVPILVATGQGKPKPDADQQHRNANPEISTPTAGNTTGLKAEPDPREKENYPENKKQNVVRRILNSIVDNTGLILVAIAGIIVAGMTLAAIKDQAKAMRESVELLGNQTLANIDAANAAKTSAEALINIERAWIIVEDLPSPDNFWNRIRAMSQGGFRSKISVSIKFLNYGHTPGWLVESAFDLLVSGTKDQELPLEHSDPRKLDHAEATPQGGRGIYIHDIPMRPQNYLSAQDMKRIEQGELFVYLYGYLKYRDVFKAQITALRETHLCYRLTFVERPNNTPDAYWGLCGPKGANEAT